MLKILDVSLRDGGHRSNFHFSNDHLHIILSSLDQAGIEYIEIGYRNGSLHPIANIGKAGLCAKDYLLTCRSLVKRAKIAVMVHPENVKKSDLQELKQCGVELLRICIVKDGLAAAYPIIELGKELGLEISVNFIHMSYYQEKELDEVVNKISNYQPNIIYFADSNGSMHPPDIQKIYAKYTEQYTISFGFHAHDNLGLAQANAIAALDNGVQYIDLSLVGMGKGIGNLKTEFFIAYLHALGIKKYSLKDALIAANYVRNNLKIGQEEIEMDEFLRGISDLSTADLKKYKLANKLL